MHEGWSLHHVGVAVAALEEAIEHHRLIYGSHVVGQPVADPLQKVRVCFLSRDRAGEPLFELVAPLDDADSSPIGRFLQKQIGAYHVCFEVDDLEAALAFVRANRCVVISDPVPAAAFGGRRIAWFSSATRMLTELLERKQ